MITDWVKDLLELEPHVISIHGSTLAQHYKGDANWDAIAAATEVIRQTDSLVFGNGDIHSLYESAQRIRKTGVHGVLIGRATFGNPWIFRDREKMKALLNADINPTQEDLPLTNPTREERLLMALEHACVHALLKGEGRFVQLSKHMRWYLLHFRGAKRVRNKLVRINSLTDVERIIQAALAEPEESDDDVIDIPQENVQYPELDMTCAY